MILSNADILKRKIVESSLSESWESAKVEWKVADIYISSTPQRCLCGHFPYLKSL